MPGGRRTCFRSFSPVTRQTDECAVSQCAGITGLQQICCSGKGLKDGLSLLNNWSVRMPRDSRWKRVGPDPVLRLTQYSGQRADLRSMRLDGLPATERRPMVERVPVLPRTDRIRKIPHPRTAAALQRENNFFKLSFNIRLFLSLLLSHAEFGVSAVTKRKIKRDKMALSCRFVSTFCTTVQSLSARRAFHISFKSAAAVTAVALLYRTMFGPQKSYSSKSRFQSFQSLRPILSVHTANRHTTPLSLLRPYLAPPSKYDLILSEEVAFEQVEIFPQRERTPQI